MTHPKYSVISKLLLILFVASITASATPFQANGIKIGEVDQTSAIVWTRLTTVEEGDYTKVSDAAPGMAGQLRVEYWPKGDQASRVTTTWQSVDPNANYTKQFTISGLTPDTEYELRSYARITGIDVIKSTIEGSFRTAPSADQVRPVFFTAVTGQGILSIDSGHNGHSAYNEMLNLRPDFFVHTGDVLYYDKVDYHGDLADNEVEFYNRWDSMFSLGYNKTFHSYVPTYFIKDDHDTLRDDCQPGQSYGSVSFKRGVEIYHEQTPSGPTRYRTIRWGKDLQIWITENREYRSAKNDPDGPNKTIWGPEQKAWFKSTIEASDATFKLLVSPGSVVGPDKDGKKDNHANPAFQTEGDEIRQFIAEQKNMYIVCGDRHWQYASVDPVTSAREYCTGAINGNHAKIGGNPGYNVEMHSYYGVRGGFLSVLVDRENNIPQITFRWHDADIIDQSTGAFGIAYEETLRPYGFGLATINTNYVDGDMGVQFMSTKGAQYRVERSFDLMNWTTVANGLEARGSLIEYRDAGILDIEPKVFYRVVEFTPTPTLPPFAGGSNGASIGISSIAGEEFNRADFVLDVEFTTPSDLGANGDFVLFEFGGTGRGTLIALQDGRLGIAGGRTGSSVVNYLGASALEASRRYSLRIEANSEGPAGSDSLVASLWRQGDAGPSTIINDTGLDLDGFSGSDSGGVGFVNNQHFTGGLALPTASAPGTIAISIEAYDPDDATVDLVIPDQPMP